MNKNYEEEFNKRTKGAKEENISEIIEQEEDLKEKYAGWTIDKFSDTQIVISKKEEGECGEHYIVKDKEGKVVIYKLLEDGTEKEYEVTDISTEYITDTDKINMKNGIKVNGKQELNQLIEDFE